MASITELKASLTKTEAAINHILTTGQKYSIVGQHSVENPALTALYKERNRIRKELSKKLGYKLSRTRPDFS